MKQIRIYLALALAVAALLPNVLWANSADWPIEIFESMDNSKLIIFLKDEDIAVSPEWQPASGAPPMGIATVLKKVNQWIADDASLKGLSVNEIELKPINKHKRHWYYLVQLKSAKNTKQKPSYVAVLLSGKVVPAMVEPASIK